jgi:GTP-binding protein
LFDRVEIVVRAGSGGDGAVSFRREKYVPFGGPDGGDGGEGGAVVIMADPAVTSLGMFRHKGVYKAGNGENGRGKKQHGKNGDDLVLKVPVGTVALDKNREDDEALIADCEQAGQREVIARGGRGGLGNTHYVSSTNQAPRIAQEGEAGEELSLVLELRLIADAGIIGYPNVGKSTLLAAASAAKPKIASYPFTTLEPVPGVIEDERQNFVVAEIPGLIDGAHLGKGLGHDFLRHIMRTRILIHLIDGTSMSPVEDMVRVNTELSLFDETLAKKSQIVVVNKIDLPEVQAKLSEIRTAFKNVGTSVLFISAATGEGVAELMAEVMKLLNQVAAGAKAGKKVPRAVFRPQPRVTGVSVQKKEEAYVVRAPELERMVARVDVADPEVRQQLQRQLDRLGVRKALEKAGIKPGDKVSCGDYEWEW